MKINFDYKKTKMILDYNDEGCLNHITNTETGKKMMVEYTQ